MSHMTHKSHVKFICFNASMLNEFVDILLIIIILIIILQGALIDQRAVAAGKNLLNCQHASPSFPALCRICPQSYSFRSIQPHLHVALPHPSLLLAGWQLGFGFRKTKVMGFLLRQN